MTIVIAKNQEELNEIVVANGWHIQPKVHRDFPIYCVVHSDGTIRFGNKPITLKEYLNGKQ
jgi:hypothetical protein